MLLTPSIPGTSTRLTAVTTGAVLAALAVLATVEAHRVGMLGLPGRPANVAVVTGLVLLSLAGPAAAFGIGRRVAPAVPPALVALLAAGLIVALAMAAGLLEARPVRQALAHARPDLVLVAGLAAAAAFAPRAIATGLGVVAAGLGLLVTVGAVVRVLYGSITGAAVTPDLLTYFASNLSDVLPVIASEAHPSRLALLGLPVLMLPVLFAVAKRRAAGSPSEGRVQVGWPLVAVVLTLLGLPGAADAGGSSTVGLVTQAIRSPPVCVDQQAAAGQGQAARFTRPVEANVELRATERTRPLNVVVLLLESFRERSVLPIDGGESHSPFVAGLLERGLRPTELYASVTHTNKALGPILAGGYAYPRPHYLETGHTTSQGLPDLLRPHGYQSAFFTPATLSFERKDRILRQLGFEVARGNESFDPTGFGGSNYFGYEDRIVLEPILDWVDTRRADGRPFLLAILTLTTHHPYTIPGAPPRDQGAEGRLHEYHAAMRYTDGFVRDLFAGFESRGLMDNTVFVVLGDHGEAFGEHGMWQHSHVVYDEVLHVPAVVMAPGLEPGVAAGPRSTLDVVPTIGDLLGFEVRGSLPGRSLRSPADSTRPVFGAALNGYEAVALRRGRLKYIVRSGRPVEVYDIAADPGETTPVTERVHPDTLAGVEAEVAAWRAAVDAAWREVACE